MTPKQITQLLEDIETAKTKLARNQGLLQAATEALTAEGFESIEEAEAWLVKADEEAEALQYRLESLRSEFDEKYDKQIRKL